MILLTTDLHVLNEKEKNFREKQENKYFWLNITNQKLCKQITKALSPYLTDEQLKMLAHPWSTQLNEIMNNLVQAVAPKTKNFFGTISLKIRICIAARLLEIGHHVFWTRVFRKIDLDMNSAFASSLQACDKKKNRRGRYRRVRKVGWCGGNIISQNLNNNIKSKWL